MRQAVEPRLCLQFRDEAGISDGDGDVICERLDQVTLLWSKCLTRCAEDLNLRDQAPAIRKLVGDPDESTAVQAIGTLGRWGDEASRSLFEEAAKSKNLRLQNAAKAALKRLN